MDSMEQRERVSPPLSSIVKNLTVSILQHCEYLHPSDEGLEEPSVIIENLSFEDQKQEDPPDSEQNKSVSRLEIQINKNGFQVTPLAGEHFLLIYTAALQRGKRVELGSLMMTNYRFLFCKKDLKIVDLPFGLIHEVDYVESSHSVIVRLKYPHEWNFRIVNPKSKFHLIKKIAMLYVKPFQLKDRFCFEHFKKLRAEQQSPNSKFNLAQEYQRLHFDKHEGLGEHFDNSSFEVCQSYPPSFFVPLSNTKIFQAASHRKNKRLPILAYVYKSAHGKTASPLWISSSYEHQKEVNKKTEHQLLKGLSVSGSLEVFVVESKKPKVNEEAHFKGKVGMHYLNIEPNEELRECELRLIEVFLFRKKPFIQEVIRSGWYRFVFSTLKAVLTIRNTLLDQKSLLVRCDSGWDKSLVLASLVQIVLDPEFRTTKGLVSLIMRMFIYKGHPFASRLGQKGMGKQMCPIFLLFLDCLSQLLNQNQTAFEFNFKYLSQLANLMQNNIYGTFAADSAKEFLQQNVEEETVPIWDHLDSPTTSNAYYVKNNGVLSFSGAADQCRVWKEYFASLISRKQDYYQLEQEAEDNQDYPNLFTKKVSEDNVRLRQEIKARLKKLQKLKQELQQAQSVSDIS